MSRKYSLTSECKGNKTFSIKQIFQTLNFKINRKITLINKKTNKKNILSLIIYTSNITRYII